MPGPIAVLSLSNRNKRQFNLVEKCLQTGLFVGYVPGFIGAHSQGATLEELYHNLQEVIEMLLEGNCLEPAVH